MSSSPTNKSAATADAACIKEDATSANAHSLSKPKEESPSVSQSNSSESTDPPINAKSEESQPSNSDCSSFNPIVKSVRSAWKKAKFRPRRWRRTMDLDQARKDCQEIDSDESKTHAMEESKEKQEQNQNSTNASSVQPAGTSSNPSGGACALSVQNNSSSSNSGASATVRFTSELRSRENTVRTLSEHQKRISRANYQVDYTNYLIPALTDIFNCPFYWGKMDRYEAEALLANKPEGSFLLRDSAQENYVFSVSFRRYSRSLHARIEETKHKFSFDCHDPGVHASENIKGLLEFYKDPLSCMFFEPMLLFPILRKKPFNLQELSRTVICDNMVSHEGISKYDGISQLQLPKTLKSFLREYHYKHKVDSRTLEGAASLQNPLLNLPQPSTSTTEESANDLSAPTAPSTEKFNVVQNDPTPKKD